MGIVHGKKDANKSSHRFDPFDGLDDCITDKNLFADLSSVADVHVRSSAPIRGSQKNHTAVTDIRRGGLGKHFILGALLVAASGFAFARFKPWTYFNSQEIVYAYFEVRALDTAGRPIAGAVVKNAGKRVGTTDSFGEWRRYMKVPLGATVPVTLAKKSASQLLYATKNFAVPPMKPDKSEIELRGSVQLQVADSNDIDAKTAVSVFPNDMVRSSAQAKTTNGDSTSVESLTLTAVSEEQKVKTPAPKASVDTGDSKLGPLARAQMSNGFFSSHESIWFELNSSPGSTLSREVLPALKRRAAELGLRVDQNSKWKVRLTSLIEKPSRVEKDGGGLILVTSLDEEKDGVSRDFLRAYNADGVQTAKGILFVLARHVNKNVAIQKLGERWVAILAKSTPDIWKLSAGIALSGEGGSFVLSGEEYADEKFNGFYLTKSGNEPCVKGGAGCEAKTRSFGDVPPVPTWTKLKLKVGALGKEPVKIFVSGYEATAIGDRVYEYWGQDKGRANVTVVQAGRVIQRGQIANESSSPASLGVANISRR